MASFGAVYQGQPKRLWTYLLAVDSKVPSGRPWTGIYIVSDHAQSLGALAQLKPLFQQFENHSFLALAILHFAASTSPDVNDIGRKLDALSWNLDRNHGVITWIANPANMTVDAFKLAPQLPFSLVGSGRNPVVPGLTNPETQPLFALSPGAANGKNLFIARTSQALMKLDGNAQSDALVLTCADPFSIACGSSKADGQKAVVTGLSNLTIPVVDTNNGCLVFNGTLAATNSDLLVGFQFAVTALQNAVPSGPLSYPLLDKPNGLAGRPVSAMLSILAPLDIAHSYFSLAASKDAIDSAFRTLLDRTIQLAPQPDGSSRLVFNTGFGGTHYLTPHGAFALGLGGKVEPNKYGLGNQLLCGLSGVEYIHFAEGDFLQFYSGNAAAVTVQIDADIDPPANITFLGLTKDATTAWAMILPAHPAQADVRQYYSEPDQAPFFAKSDVSADPEELGYYGLSLSSLPDAPSDKAKFPLLPYASFVTGAGDFGGGNVVYAEALEFQLINPTRKSQIEAMAAVSSRSHTGQGGDTITAITPEGYAATFAGNDWKMLEIAQMGADEGKDTSPSYISIGFSAADNAKALPQALQDAFLTNQQFLVITTSKNLGTFDPTVRMNGWPFKLTLTDTTTVGDYRNVIIFKSANATVSQLARHPELWTHYQDFNDTTHDPDGRFLSNWLVDYLTQAKQLFAGGQGIASLGDFCELIDDPHWNGFLALKVAINLDKLPAEIEALLAGVADKSLFLAHHIGNEVNFVTPPSKTVPHYALNSAMFGLVHYVDPNFGTQVNDIPSYISNPQPYDFKVLTLEAVFENAQLLNFTNKSLLTLNTIFGDAVLQTDAAGDSGANTLVLIGSYNSKASPAYTFGTAKGAITDFYLSSNALDCVEITRTTMTVTPTSTIEQNVTGECQCSQTTTTTTEDGYLARFNLFGNLRLMSNPGFDILSYDTLGFSNLGLDMYLLKGGAGRYFGFDSSMLRLALTKTVAVDPAKPPESKNAGSNLVRTGSLLAQFPLQLTGFVSGCGNRQPAAMGFRTLETTEPKGITPGDLGGGDWYALSFDLNLGGQGALGQNGGLTAKFLLAWAPGGQQSLPSVLPALKIAGPGGVSLSFDIEGVVKFGAADIVLNRLPKGDKTAAQFVLMFESIAFSVLSFSFPPAGSTNIFLFGTTDAQSGEVLKPTLGWFGGYVAQQPPTTAGA